MQTGKFSSFLNKNSNTQKSSIPYMYSAGSTCTKTTVSGIKSAQKNTPQFVLNCFQPAPMLGLSSRAIEWLLDKGIQSRRRTYLLECRPTSPLFLSFLFLSSSFLSSFILFFLSFFLSFLSFLPSFSTHRTDLPLPLSLVGVRCRTPNSNHLDTWQTISMCFPCLNLIHPCHALFEGMCNAPVPRECTVHETIGAYTSTKCHIVESWR